MSTRLSDLKPVVALFLAERRRGLLIGALMSALTVLAGIALLGLSGWFITAASIAGLSVATAVTFDVFAPSAGIRLLAIGRTFSRYGERMTTHDATLSVLAALRERLFRGWAKGGAARHLAARPSSLLFRLTADIDALDGLYLRVLVPAAVAICAAIAASVALGLIHPLLGASTGLLLLLAGLGIPYAAGRAAAKSARRRTHGVEAVRGRVIDLVAGQTDLLMAGRLDAQCAAVATADIYTSAADDRLNRIETGVALGFGLTSSLLLGGSLLAVAALAGAGAIGAPVAALGMLVAFAAIEPFAALRRGAIELGRTLIAARRVGGRLTAPDRVSEHAAPAPGIAFALTDVAAAHDGAERLAISKLSLTLKANEKLALIGASGAGKSSFLALLAGELRPQSGTAAITDSTLLTQRTELFADSIRGNLLIADPSANESQLRDALDAAGLLTTIDALPKGLDTKLGEGGLGLSGGQSRRLALARLFLRNASLWLLDEPTEGLDGDTARDVMDRLAERADGRAVVIASHIRREAAIADLIAVIEDGRITDIARRGEAAFERALDRLRPD
ncbi:ATP-binding cassette domain-containing protein [Rhizobium sp. BG4]|uniref:amino acid ABC transporter ATP-binding/permease protein n=1 Tax=Rhizobium sp. BG4 TaxID=2613770 RepID=UPI00193DBCDB|nr:ATP-binding cassette domain-containing protein [Rhizobium sp. BG4]QRM46455.1 ATP-binding cassette domain-containing protein [Rhizobium sp. BG4]